MSGAGQGNPPVASVLPQAVDAFPFIETIKEGTNLNTLTELTNELNSNMLNVVLFSPIILVSSIIFLSFSYQNYKGFVYLGFLLGLCLLRGVIFSFNEWDKSITNKCNSIIQFGEYGGSSISSFIFGFTLMYILFPMLYNKEVNIWILFGLGIYFATDLLTRLKFSCVTFANYISNFLVGILSAIIIISLMYAGGSGKYMFFNEFSNNSQVCYRPDKETFKCEVYKNGELLGNV